LVLYSGGMKFFVVRQGEEALCRRKLVGEICLEAFCRIVWLSAYAGMTGRTIDFHIKCTQTPPLDAAGGSVIQAQSVPKRNPWRAILA